jgi:predicted signal transduction protein with EAL and GGDEF domain
VLFYLDLDQFKIVNSSSHRDELLKMVGNAGRRQKDVPRVARLGGDEFGVLITDIETEPRAKSPNAC